MNDISNPQPSTNPPFKTSERKSSKNIRSTVPLDPELYREIESLLPALSDQIGSKVTMPVFLRKTIIENWKVQMERYRKLNPCANRKAS